MCNLHCFQPRTRVPFNKFTHFDMRTTESESDFRRTLTTSTAARSRALAPASVPASLLLFLERGRPLFVRFHLFFICSDEMLAPNKTLHNLLKFVFFFFVFVFFFSKLGLKRNAFAARQRCKRIIKKFCVCL